MKTYRIVYESKCTEIMNVYLDDDLEIPEDFHKWELPAQDEWLYENQLSCRKVYTDQEWGQAVAIMPLVELEEK